MTQFDYLVIGTLAASMLLGFWRGVVGEVLTLAGWVVGYLVAKHFGGWIADRFLGTVFADPTLRVIAGWIVAFLAVLLLFALLRAALRGLLRVVGLGMIDRLFGLFFGLARGGLLVLLGVTIAGMTPLPTNDWWKHALLSPYLEKAVLFSAPWLPVEVNSRIRFN
jgi:membrane protein required for colicin V production